MSETLSNGSTITFRFAQELIAANSCLRQEEYEGGEMREDQMGASDKCSREKTWQERDADEKIEWLRDVVANTVERIGILTEFLNDLADHEHNTQGQLTKRLSPGRTEGPFWAMKYSKDFLR